MMERVRETIADLSMRVSLVSDSPVDREKGPSGITLKRELDLPLPGLDPGHAEKADSQRQTEPVRKGKKIGRNDPCPCGSGKKYKHCCGRNS